MALSVLVLPATLLGQAPTAAAHPLAERTGILTRLKAVPGLRVLGEAPAPAGHRAFRMAYRQPVDHRGPARGTFEQRLILLHRSTDRPTVLYTNGYALNPDTGFVSEPAALLDGNQLSVEQRYFEASTPSPTDYSALDIRQAASDHHRLVRALRPLYTRAWISTGGSKGGMASVYHRRFFPRDVQGTVAYSAPNNTDDGDDSAVDAFLGRVGTARCRAALRSAQREALLRREEMVARYTRWAARTGRTFFVVGSADRAFELAVLRTPLNFWMGKDPGDRAAIPAPSASTDALYAFFEDAGQLPVLTDQVLSRVVASFCQLGTQLGNFEVRAAHLDGLLRHPGVQQARTYVPREIPLRFQPRAMPDIDRWVRRHGSELLLVYGERDPVRAEPFRPGPGSRDTHVLLAPGANHVARIEKLAPRDRARAVAALKRWAGAAA